MRHSKTEKANTHKRIVAVAAKKFLEEGLTGIGIADLMKEAGLTVGGFYKHFKSRDALVAEAVGSALELWQRQVDSAPLPRSIRTPGACFYWHRRLCCPGPIGMVLGPNLRMLHTSIEVHL